MIAGDLNFHVDDLTDKDACTFLDILDSANLEQYVIGPTHRDGHTLDVVISRRSDNLVDNFSIWDDIYTPVVHYGVKCYIDMARPKAAKKFLKCREIRKIDMEQFRHDILSSSVVIQPQADHDALVNQYMSDLRGILNQHAPEKEREITLRPHAPWYNDALRDAKREKRRCERKWKKSKLEVHKQIYKEQCRTYKTLLDKEKSSYHSDQVASANQKELFRVIDRLSKPSSDHVLPSHKCPRELANRFAEFFDNKIKKLREGLDKTDSDAAFCDSEVSSGISFSVFDQLSEEDVYEIIRAAPIKSCPLDPLPSSVFKECVDILLPTITKIVNTSLQSGTVPHALKTARVLPLLKKASLDPEEPRNYRPVSNLPPLFKIIERAAVKQVQEYLDVNNLHAKMRPCHSTETALLRINNDLLRAIDQHQEAVLILLDMTAAFDTIDHQMLLDRLSKRYGICGTALSWFASYLDGRSQRVVIKDSVSDPTTLECGVPQGSMAGPIKFVMYSAPLQDIISSHGISSVMYADDTQLYIMFHPDDRNTAISRIEACVDDVKSRAVKNKRALNDSKTEVIHLSSRFRVAHSLSHVTIGQIDITPKEQVRNLGVVFDSGLRMTDHINSICKAAHNAIRKIGRIRQYLDKPTTERLVHAFVTFRLDCCNSLLYGLPESEILKLQRVQNIAARLVCQIKRKEHITPYLRELHWLPIHQRIIYKLLLYTFKALHDEAPTYICELLQRHNPNRILRSGSQLRLHVPKTLTSSYGMRAFSVAAPMLWNLFHFPCKHFKIWNWKTEVSTFS